MIKEAGLEPDAGTTHAGDLTIEKILEEKKQFDASLAFEKTPDSVTRGWTSPGRSPACPIHLPERFSSKFCRRNSTLPQPGFPADQTQHHQGLHQYRQYPPRPTFCAFAETHRLEEATSMRPSQTASC